jgi:hypothetical protein
LGGIAGFKTGDVFGGLGKLMGAFQKTMGVWETRGAWGVCSTTTTDPTDPGVLRNTADILGR